MKPSIWTRNYSKFSEEVKKIDSPESEG